MITVPDWTVLTFVVVIALVLVMIVRRTPPHLLPELLRILLAELRNWFGKG